MSKRINWILLMFLFDLACAHKTPQQKFLEFIDNPRNKIKQQLTVGDITVSLKWMPLSYRRMISPSAPLNDDYDYFDANFEKATDEKMTKERTMYLDFDMQKDFILAIGRDSVMPTICQRIQNGRKNSYEYILAFQKPNDADLDFAIVYKDEIFGVDNIIFVYNHQDLHKIPTLAAK